MAHNPGSLKRQKELARLEWQREKAAKRKERKAAKARGEILDDGAESLPESSASAPSK